MEITGEVIEDQLAASQGDILRAQMGVYDAFEALGHAKGTRFLAQHHGQLLMRPEPEAEVPPEETSGEEEEAAASLSPSGD